MTLQEAIREMQSGKRATRKQWPELYAPIEINRILFPENQQVITTRNYDGDDDPWIHTVADLLADDWEVVQ